MLLFRVSERLPKGTFLVRRTNRPSQGSCCCCSFSKKCQNGAFLFCFVFVLWLITHRVNYFLSLTVKIDNSDICFHDVLHSWSEL